MPSWVRRHSGDVFATGAVAVLIKTWPPITMKQIRVKSRTIRKLEEFWRCRSPSQIGSRVLVP
eukprot:scaffold22360_cov84-Amphora_coffeaeformis.AAC.1